MSKLITLNIPRSLKLESLDNNDIAYNEYICLHRGAGFIQYLLSQRDR